VAQYTDRLNTDIKDRMNRPTTLASGQPRFANHMHTPRGLNPLSSVRIPVPCPSPTNTDQILSLSQQNNKIIGPYSRQAHT